jgi:hypothetical protein
LRSARSVSKLRSKLHTDHDRRAQSRVAIAVPPILVCEAFSVLELLKSVCNPIFRVA